MRCWTCIWVPSRFGTYRRRVFTNVLFSNLVDKDEGIQGQGLERQSHVAHTQNHPTAHKTSANVKLDFLSIDLLVENRLFGFVNTCTASRLETFVLPLRHAAALYTVSAQMKVLNVAQVCG